MYYEEMIIDGVLCWRSTPDGEWSKKTPQQLTAMLTQARQQWHGQPQLSGGYNGQPNHAANRATRECK